jgi:hypothetical protein
MRRLALFAVLLAASSIGASVGAQPAPNPRPAAPAATTTPPAAVRPVVRPAAGGISFKAEIPAPPESLPVLRLTAQPAPTAIIDQLLGSSREPAKLAPLSESPLFRENQLRAPADTLGVVKGDHVRAWVDVKSGDAEVYPELSTLQPLPEAAAAERSIGRGAEILRSPEFLARDDTRVVISRPLMLNGATYVRDAAGAPARAEKPKAAYLAYISAQRFVGEYPVTGPGSRATVALGAGGAVEALVRSWKAGKIEQSVKPTMTAGQAREEILRQLRPSTANGGDVTVDSVDIAYYDGARDWLQPVYRFTARVHRARGVGSDDFLVGYVPLSQLREPLPVLGQPKGPAPSYAATREPPRPGVGAAPAKPNDPIVGRYVVRQDDPNWVADANEFWGGLTSTWTSPLFTNSQYFWAEPRLFTTQKNSFINAMNLALVEVHGDWWLYSTLKNCCDLVNINGDIPFPGYGPSASGKLADWVIHSCEVVPAPEDTAGWANPWWTIFGGVRNVVGYRTIMYIDDDAGGPYGTSLGHVAPVVSSWLNDVISLGAYSGHPTTAAHGGIVRPMGRPSTISACGHDGDSVFSTSSLGRASCLTVWWFPD